MNTNRLSSTLTKQLNAQMTLEAHAAQIYLSYGAWAQENGYPGTAKFLFRHAEEERNHMMKILEFILNRGGSVKVTAIPAPPEDPATLQACFEAIYTHEVANTTAIYKLVKMSFQEDDWATWGFMQWFVKEQVEEESFAMDLLDKLKMAGGDKAEQKALYMLDQSLEHDPGEARAAEDVTAVDP